MVLIAIGGVTVEPAIFLTFENARAAQSIVHPILGREYPDATLRPAQARSGRLELGFSGEGAETTSKAAQDALALAAVAVLTDADRPSHNMTFVVQGEVSRPIEDTTRNAWIVSCGFQEVAP
ncbi:hypothetical protein [Microbacterium sp. RG1]|uniref:hypothetical protein n=1 Tax=Microbacterium sp. RG1 TaxID=2489212 RepID=UPI0010CA4BA5|nr:hypothetical protein [Microbacterium sp. RG1]QCQ16985.1 hypothetical protein EHF32_09785 [Microbacterium sp. RG1]